jgi:4'-phosphopantetheinyl transferase
MLSARRARRWSRARGVLRALLGRYLEADPRALRFATGTHGRPVLLDDAACLTSVAEPPSAKSAPSRPAQLSFNLSHSAGLALYAFADGAAIGVDIEVAKSSVNELALAERAFGPTQVRRLESLEPPIRAREFLRTWVRHEAELKCRGIGIGSGQRNARVTDMWVVELDVGTPAAAAVALAQAPLELRCWEWHAEPADALRTA